MDKKTEKQLMLERFNIFFCIDCSMDEKELQFVDNKIRTPTFCYHEFIKNLHRDKPMRKEKFSLKY